MHHRVPPFIFFQRFSGIVAGKPYNGSSKMVRYSEISIQTDRRSQWIDVTRQVDRIVGESGIKAGICLITSPHTTAGITINENADPDVQADFFQKINQLIPQDPSFRHTEGNSDSHLKASLVGLSVQIPVFSGRLVLGTWQSVYFCEFDGPRRRRAGITVMGE